MRIEVNGKPREVAAGSTLADLLREVGVATQLTAVARNGVIVQRDQYEHTSFSEGDRLEVVTMVGGG